MSIIDDNERDNIVTFNLQMNQKVYTAVEDHFTIVKKYEDLGFNIVFLKTQLLK